jgi:hypothetical protein
MGVATGVFVRVRTRSSTVPGAVPATAGGKPRPQKRCQRVRAAYSFIGGSLIGIAVSLVVLNAGEGDGELMLLVAMILASSGIGMYLSGSKTTAHRGKDSSVQVKSSASARKA